jgi:glycosyltransferase involved in cell wall biosynthesis
VRDYRLAIFGAEGFDVRVLRIYHGGRDASHRARDRALVAAGLDVTLVVPAHWPDGGMQEHLSDEPFDIVELPVDRPGDVNRHSYRSPGGLGRLVASLQPDVVDVHAEPVSLSARQWIRAAQGLPIVMYAAQNVDKRYPPPFAQYEQAAYRAVDGLYPCSRQAASVARGKGFTGLVEVLPLGVDPLYVAGDQRLDDPVLQVGLIGRLVPEKGVLDAVRVVGALGRERRVRLVIVGQGPVQGAAERLARDLGVELTLLPWQPVETLAALYRELHLVLVPSRATGTWVEQFGRIIVEGQAAGAVIAGYDSGAIAEVGGDACVLVPEGQVETLATGVAALVADPARYDSLRRLGLARASATTWTTVAARQAELYARVSSGGMPRRPAARTATRRRQLAHDEFGPTAELAGGQVRPFALPVLREDTALARVAAGVLDGTTRRLGR